MGLGDDSSSSWGRLAADGCTSTGATMSVAHGAGPARTASGGHRCCSCGGGQCVVNIYVNNNVQGVTNSVLVGSKVVIRDPGARVSSGRRRRGGHRDGKQRRQWQKVNTNKIGAMLLSLAATAVVLCLVPFVHVRKLS